MTAPALGSKRPAPCTHLLNLNLPADIAVYADKQIQPQAAEALDMLSSRLGFRYHFVGRRDAELQIHFVSGSEYMESSRGGEAFLPLSPRFDGIARVRTRDSWVIAHEICHVLGFEHSATGLMSPRRSSKLSDGITDAEIHRASLVRAAAAAKN
jgi:hypothetical protein